MAKVGPFQQPAVLGAGVMGGRIAALLANAGYRVKLYERPPTDTTLSANALSLAAIERLFQETPAPFSGSEAATLIIPRNYQEHWSELAEHDLIIETYDGLEAKQGWLTRLTPRMSKHATILSLLEMEDVSAIAKAVPAGLRPQFMAAHFTRIPLYRRLVELIPTDRTEERITVRLMQFLTHHIGMIPYTIEQIPLSFRLADFVINHAFVIGEKYQLTVAEIEMLTTLVTGAQSGGVCALADDIGVEKLVMIHDKLPSTPFTPPLSSILTKRKRFYDYQDFPSLFYQQDSQIAPTLIHALENADWKALVAMDTAHAGFVRTFLSDYWQYLAFLAKEAKLSGAQIDEIHRHAFAWQHPPYQLLQHFSPPEVYAYTQEKQKTYPLQTLWRRRPRTITQETPQQDSFLSCCHQHADLAHSRFYTYQDAFLVWQPKAERCGFDTDILSELDKALAQARRHNQAVMIYHHGQQFGGINAITRLNQEERQREQSALNTVIIALRMHPQPIMLSVTGTIADHGCAIMMQADRVISTVDLAWRLRTIKYGLPPIGGTWFEWLRRLPRLNREHGLIQIHTVLTLLYSRSGVNSVHAARELGILRSHDRFSMTPAQLPNATRTMVDAWLGSAQPRPLRYPLYKLTPTEHQQLLARAHTTPNPERYRQSLALLADSEQSHILSLRRFLPMETAVYNAALDQLNAMDTLL